MDTVVSADGTAIAVDRYGAGPPVIMAAGAFNTRAATEPLARALQEQCFPAAKTHVQVTAAMTVYRRTRRQQPRAEKLPKLTTVRNGRPGHHIQILKTPSADSVRLVVLGAGRGTGHRSAMDVLCAAGAAT